MTTNINELDRKNASTTNPCTLVSSYLMHEEEGGTLSSFLRLFDFNSREDVERAVRMFVRTCTMDAYMRKKHLADDDPFAAAVFTRYERIMKDASKIDKYPVALSGEIWHGGFNRQRLEARVRAFYGDIEPDADVFAATKRKLRDAYGFSVTDIDKIHFFVEQVKAGSAFPNSLRRMLYFWGLKKKTGKTTSATMLVALLNGDTNEHNISRYSTVLTNEMQIGNFKVPKISECSVCMMDECFYADMGKTYSDFKRFLTSANGRARLPYGQEFEWEGYPNYVSTSNEPLRKFIKDWGDRRYLSVEFKTQPLVKMDFDEIKAMWSDFVRHSQRTRDWQEWADDLYEVSEEMGERAEVCDEIEIDLRKLDMLNRVLNLQTPSTSPACAQNHVSLKTFVDWFSETMGNVEAHKRKGEIEAAVLKVYGARYSTTSYWLLSSLQDTANKLKNEINNTIDPTDDGTDDDLPF